MTNNLHNKLEKRARLLVESEGINWTAMRKGAKQIIVFGSYACGRESTSSDFDMLLVGKGKSYRSKRVHLIWIKEERLKDISWINGELGTHVARYGRWIKGESGWTKFSKPDAGAIKRKKDRIMARLNALEKEWHLLLAPFRKKQLIRLRRDVQRLSYLEKGLPVVVGAALDEQWDSTKNQVENLNVLLEKNARIRRKMFRFLRKSGASLK